MNGSDQRTTNLSAIEERIAGLVEARGWDQLRTLKDLAAAISIEAGELQELFLWLDPEQEVSQLATRRREIESELADVLIYAVGFAQRAGIDVLDAMAMKLAEVEARASTDPHPG